MHLFAVNPSLSELSMLSTCLMCILPAGTKRKRSPEKNSEVKKKRVRTIYTKEHLWRLEAFFANSPYPDLLMREEIAEQLDLTEQKIHVGLSVPELC